MGLYIYSKYLSFITFFSLFTIYFKPVDKNKKIIQPISAYLQFGILKLSYFLPRFFFFFKKLNIKYAGEALLRHHTLKHHNTVFSIAILMWYFIPPMLLVMVRPSFRNKEAQSFSLFKKTQLYSALFSFVSLSLSPSVSIPGGRGTALPQGLARNLVSRSLERWLLCNVRISSCKCNYIPFIIRGN